MPKLWQQAAAASLAVMVTVLVPVSSAFADSKPYFQTLYGGPFAGGAFKDAGGSCSTNYQTPYGGGGSPDYYQGAIMAFGTTGPREGAHSSLDAFALGKIEGDGAAAKQYGFYSGNSGFNQLSYSNVNTASPAISDFWGGNLEGQAAGAHCIPDYYDSFLDMDGATTYSVSRTIVADGSTKNVSAGSKEIIFVDGDAYIGGNVVYGSHTVDNVPKFALVVKGNIYIGPNVTQLDGWYIAQPDGANGGEIWTCHDNSSDLPKDTWMRDNCDSSLTVYGAFTAAQVNLGRINGNISGSSAETINYTPEMVLGGSFFEDTSASEGATGAIQSLVNLPPIF
jgi:hypothetical protein